MENQQPEHAGQDVIEAHGGPLMTCSSMCTENGMKNLTV